MSGGHCCAGDGHTPDFENTPRETEPLFLKSFRAGNRNIPPTVRKYGKINFEISGVSGQDARSVFLKI
jgi:hypothetical protein